MWYIHNNFFFSFFFFYFFFCFLHIELTPFIFFKPKLISDSDKMILFMINYQMTMSEFLLQNIELI